ncbi:hypothetical protein AB7W80_20485 [Providencia rettgeri]|uniref:Uncharacterized protein n=1 Tax=Providencia rettgeri TaxID=587 RepID=A0AAE2ZFY2_PRORE|nr:MULTISPECIES: hypothetical protein [Providencia]MBW3117278.1 hypothetical protein [Providencia rettgeri]MDX7424913.1 hypothetical protein [Providencia sp. CIM-Carb-044]
MKVNELKLLIETNKNNNFINNKKPFVYNIKEKPINTDGVASLKKKFEELDRKTDSFKKTQTNKPQSYIKKELSEYDNYAFGNDLTKKNLYFIYSSPDSKKIELIHNHNKNKINNDNAIFINMFSLLKNEPDGSIYKINNHTIKIANKNKELTTNDNRFTHKITLKNGKDILIERYNEKSKFSF